jgi:hypothetical protein
MDAFVVDIARARETDRMCNRDRNFGFDQELRDFLRSIEAFNEQLSILVSTPVPFVGDENHRRQVSIIKRLAEFEAFEVRNRRVLTTCGISSASISLYRGRDRANRKMRFSSWRRPSKSSAAPWEKGTCTATSTERFSLLQLEGAGWYARPRARLRMRVDRGTGDRLSMFMIMSSRYAYVSSFRLISILTRPSPDPSEGIEVWPPTEVPSTDTRSSAGDREERPEGVVVVMIQRSWATLAKHTRC